MRSCPFCKTEPPSNTCCKAASAYSRGEKKAKQAFEFRRSPSPHKKARAKKIIDDYNS